MSQRPSEIFGSHVFGLATMKQKLPKATYRALTDAIAKGSKLSLEHANAVAHVMMEWALDKGATHYTHLFQPMTGLTAQKHDAFFTLDSQIGSLESFSGNDLIQSEPDASSFPSGGMRTTFEARGYTAWDPSSPVYVMDNADVTVLCIPSVFFSYTGQALDKKTPLLRSIRRLDEVASKALELLGKQTAGVNASVGCEQEYFLVDQKWFNARPDLIMAGRTLLGARPAKGQQMEDHYFGSIKDRVLSFMQTMEQRLYRLGVPCKTRHNEVAPHQFEMAPIFETANLAADHNQLSMEVMRRTAKEFGLEVLLHEKPFAGVNGSGKHVNWSVATLEGVNLLEPGSDPHKNLEFLYFLVAVVNAIHKRGAILRATISGPGNDHRLGANEAPPAIMSVFLGSHLAHVLDTIESASEFNRAAIEAIDLGLSQIPEIQVHNTDRNRTSPFAFTGNKFEFRAVGSSQSVSLPIALLNAAVADSLEELNEALAKLPNRDEKHVLEMLRPFISRSKVVRFEGNNYSEEWAQEAARRGLPNNKTTPEALEAWRDEETRHFILRSGLLREAEMEARYHVNLEHYANVRNIEAELMLRMIDTQILPGCLAYQQQVAGAVSSLKQSGVASGAVKRQETLLATVANNVSDLLDARDRLESAINEANGLSDAHDRAYAFSRQVVPAMDEARDYADILEGQVPASQWELPTYHELLFLM